MAQLVWIKANVAVSVALVGSLIGSTATATMGYQSIMSRLDRHEEAIYGAPSDRSEPGLRSNMKSVDSRLNTLTASVAALAVRLDEISAQLEDLKPHKRGPTWPRQP